MRLVILLKHHQVHIDGGGHAVLAQRLADHGANGEVGYVVIVHHIEVHHVGAGGQHVIDFLAKTGKIGGQDGWGNQVRVHDGSLTTMDNGLVSGPCRTFRMAASLTAQWRFFAVKGSVSVQRFEIYRPGVFWLFVLALMCVAPSITLGQEESGTAGEAEGVEASESASRALIWTGTGERSLIQRFPESAVWLELEEGDRSLGLFYPEARLPARGAVLVLS